jgi:hypothetical protein
VVDDPLGHLADLEVLVRAEPAAEVLKDGTPLVELAAPWLAAVGAAVGPLLSAAGLTPDTPTREILEDADLVDRLVGAARDAVRSGGFSTGPELLAGRDRSVTWAVGSAPRALALMRGPDGPVCPEVPGFPDAGPCSPRESSGGALAGCLDDHKFEDARERLESLRHVDRLAGRVEGREYTDALIDSIAEGAAHRGAIYECGGGLPGTYASYDRGDERVHLGHDFFHLGFTGDLAALLTGPADFRAGILLHEHVHRVDHQVFRVPLGLGNMAPGRCPKSEHRAALLQMRYWGLGGCLEAAGGRIYARSQGACDPDLSGRQQLLAAIDDLLRCTTVASTLLLGLSVAGAALLGAAGFAAALVPILGANAALLLTTVLLG